jgi:hypothetical protein
LFVKTTVLPCLTAKLSGTNLKLEIDTVSGSGDGEVVAVDGETKFIGDPNGKPDELVGTIDGPPKFSPLSVNAGLAVVLGGPYIDLTPKYTNNATTMTPRTIKVFFIVFF